MSIPSPVTVFFKTCFEAHWSVFEKNLDPTPQELEAHLNHCGLKHVVQLEGVVECTCALFDDYFAIFHPYKFLTKGGGHSSFACKLVMGCVSGVVWTELIHFDDMDHYPTSLEINGIYPKNDSMACAQDKRFMSVFLEQYYHAIESIPHEHECIFLLESSPPDAMVRDIVKRIWDNRKMLILSHYEYDHERSLPRAYICAMVFCARHVLRNDSTSATHFLHGGAVDSDDEEEQIEERACNVCMTNKKSFALVPCGHMFCGGCSAEIVHTSGTCPICRARFHSRHRVYI